LVSQGASLNTKNKKQRTPLGEAIFYGHQEVAKFLSSVVKNEEDVPSFKTIHTRKTTDMELEEENAPKPNQWKKVSRTQSQMTNKTQPEWKKSRKNTIICYSKEFQETR